MRSFSLSRVVLVAAVPSAVVSFTAKSPFGLRTKNRRLFSIDVAKVETPTAGFIEEELRGAAMKLHTRKQAPKEGQAEAPEEKETYVPTRNDYLQFLVDSHHVYEAMEDIVNNEDKLSVYRNTGLERTEPLAVDIEFMSKEYGLTRPAVGPAGLEYAKELRRMVQDGKIPEFMCHFYNFYFAHTAGGRMIGKQMSALLLDKKTLEFYKVRCGCADFYTDDGFSDI